MQKNHPDAKPVPDAPGNIARATMQAPPKVDFGSGRHEARRPTTKPGVPRVRALVAIAGAVVLAAPAAAQVTRDFAYRDARGHAVQVCEDRDSWWIMDWTISRYGYDPSQAVTLETIEQRYDLLRKTRRDIIAERSSLVRWPALQWTRGR